MKSIFVLLLSIFASLTGIAVLIAFELMDSRDSTGFINESFILVPIGYLLVGIGLIFALVYRTKRKQHLN